MPLSYIIKQVGDKCGLNPNDASQRPVLLRIINEAAVELYQQSDMAGCLEEQYYKVNANQTISLPDYVGQVRAMREADSQIAINLSQMRPRYNQFNWADEWRNWRVKGLQTLQNAITNQSALVLTVHAVEEPPITVNISGPTVGSSMAHEIVVMDAVSKTTTNDFLDVTAFTKTTGSKYDVIMSDIDGNRLSAISNDKLKAQYQILDISQAPWIYPNNDLYIGWVEVLYKKALPYLYNDNDEFPAIGYDNVIVNKSLQIYYEEQNNVQAALAYDSKATRSLAQIHEDANRGTDDVVSMCANPHDALFPRTGFGKDYRYAYRITGR